MGLLSTANGDVASDAWLTLTSIVSALFAALSVGAAIYVHRATRESARIGTLLQIAEWFRSEDVEEARKSIYLLNRDDVPGWKNAKSGGSKTSIEDDISIWVGYLDVVATLVLTNNVASKDLIRMYGDVIFRTMYILAPYVNRESSTRGEQYLKSTRMALPSMVKNWKKLSKAGKYPQQIVVSWESHSIITCDNYLADEAVAAFVRHS